MSKRKAVRFVEGEEVSDSAALEISRKRRAEEDGDTVDTVTGDDDATPADYCSHHTLESDEEDEEKYKRLDIDAVEGQEEASANEFDGETKITPFNMKEEMEEGHFDSTGNFIFEKKGEEIKDAWLDGIDWGKVKKDAGDLWQGGEERTEDEKPGEELDAGPVYADILELMQPKETVTKALRRLGGGESTSAERKRRWEARKEGAEGSQETPVSRLTELIDKLVAAGQMEIYGFTYEKFKFELDKMKDLSRPKDKDEELDMFAKEIDKNQQNAPAKDKPEQSRKEPDENAVMWEFKWEQAEEAEVHGPCSTQQMLDWQQQGYFDSGVWVRRVGQTDAQFYSSKRIDFDLYT